MADGTGWIRVSSANPCPICGRPDWCLISADGSAAICAREDQGALKRCGEAGWLHRLRESAWKSRGVRTFVVPDRQPRRSDLAALVSRYEACVEPGELVAFAASLGLSVPSLRRLRVGRTADGWAWSFPMVDVAGNLLGIRLRCVGGTKLAVAGGREGLFVPADLGRPSAILITEGPTDCAALLDLGFAAVGRPSCTGGTRLLAELVQMTGPRNVVIVADNDAPKAGGRRPGIEGARALAAALALHCRHVRIIMPPAGIKDARDWKRGGATTTHIRAATQGAAEYEAVVTHARIVNEDHHG